MLLMLSTAQTAVKTAMAMALMWRLLWEVRKDACFLVVACCLM
jgi:hypothetical protein